ncbi:Lrp/AsnC family transcriptional regulator [Kiloniella antarctica]|uniref:Lrp/AsnC family transcriptional regulator n=1 Tax=Kiloniella antarctica TaxID=1550907 RepID=A0ABW5BGU3_9PROT
MTMDKFDKAILRCLQENTRFKSEYIAEKVGLSATACQRRIKRLRDSRAITKEVAILNPEITGRPVTLIVQLVIGRCGAEILDQLKRDLVAEPEVQQCYNVTGAFDFVVIVTAKDMEAYERFTRRVFFDKPTIKEFETTVVMEKIKVGLEIPI